MSKIEDTVYSLSGVKKLIAEYEEAIKTLKTLEEAMESLENFKHVKTKVRDKGFKDSGSKKISNILLTYIKSSPAVSTDDIVKHYADFTGKTKLDIRNNVYTTLRRLFDLKKIERFEGVETTQGYLYKIKK